MQYLVLVLALLLFPSQLLAQTNTKVISIGDGDTLTVNRDGQKVKVRLGCIDAPEMKQTPYGEVARNYLKSILPIGAVISLRTIDRDRYGRTVAEVFKNGQSINLAMIASGQAVIYPQYFAGCLDSQSQYDQAQGQARGQRLGFWNQNNPVMPWEFRRGKRSGSSQSTQSKPSSPLSSECNPSYPEFCISEKVSCSTLKSQGQRAFKVLPPDPYRLDRDKDGIGCE